MRSATKAALKKMQERHGPVPDELKVLVKDQTRSKKRIRELLGEGPRTVPELASALGAETGATLWQLMAMKKYGAVVEVSDDGTYCRYALAETDR